MPFFTAIGLTLGAVGAASAFAVGVGATALAVGVGVAAYAAGGGFDSKDSGVDSRVQGPTGTGALTHDEAQQQSKKRAYRSGVLFTSPTGLDSDSKTSSAKLR